MPSRIVQKDSSKVYKLLAESQIREENHSHLANSISLDNLIDSIKTLIEKEQEKTDKKTVFFQQSLYLALLHDISTILELDIEDESSEKPHTWIARLKLCSLTTAGILYGACEGFDGGLAMLAPFSLSAAIVVPVGIVFSVLAIMVFCAFDRGEIAKNLGIARKDAGQLIDNYLAELTAIKAIRRELSQRIDDKLLSLINSDMEKEDDLTKNQANLRIIQHLLSRFKAINESAQKISESKKNIGLMIAKYATTGITGIIFFSGGFLTGQTVGITVAGLLSVSALPTSIPIIGIAILVGAAAFCIYWFVERPGVENLINSWFGIDKEKIAKLCDEGAMKKEQNKLENLNKKISSLASSSPKTTEPAVASTVPSLSFDTPNSSPQPRLESLPANEPLKVSNNPNSFLYATKQSASNSDTVVCAASNT